MDQLLGKITNLSYELFGIFIPGFILFLFLGWWWWCVGGLAPLLSFEYLPALGMHGVSAGYSLVTDEIKFGLVIYVAVASYFLGHLINWVGRSGGAKESEADSRFKKAVANISNCLKLSVPKPIQSYYPSLEPLLQEGIGFLKLPVGADNWAAFYPVAKHRVAQEVSQSLIVTYQNKYTLHRALAVASVIWFWLSFFLVFFAVFAASKVGLGPHWLPLFMSIPLSLLAAWGFSESYMFHWRMFGNSVITETFMLAGKST